MESGLVFKTQEIKRVRNPDVDSCIRAMGAMLEAKHGKKFITIRHPQEEGKGYIYDVFIQDSGFINKKNHFLFKVFVDFKVAGNPKKGIEVKVEPSRETAEKYGLDIEGIKSFIKKYIVG